MKIGIYFTARKEAGGVYQYSLSILEALSRVKQHEFVVLTTSPDIPKKYSKKFQVVNLSPPPKGIIARALYFGLAIISKITLTLTNNLYKLGWYRAINYLYRVTMFFPIRSINQHNLDLIFYPTSSNLSFLTNAASVVSVHDFQHRLGSQFKEVSASGRWAHREHGYFNIGKYAYRVLVDSQAGKKDMIDFYDVLPEKVVSLPYLALPHLAKNSSSTDLKKVRAKFKLPEKFIYYPARFWPHKNHLNIIKALGILKEKGVIVNLVLTGSKQADFSSFDSVTDLVDKLNLKDQVRYLGYIDNSEVAALYQLSESLVMPTLSNTSTIPVLEAWVSGTPVIYSNISGCRDQLGNAGLLVDPNNPLDIADKINQIYGNAKLQQDLVKKGKRRISQWTFEKFSKKIATIISAYNKEYGQKN